MKPGETVRFACDECQIVFDLTIAPSSEWVEQFDDNEHDDVEINPPCRCPFCNLSKLRPLHVKPCISES